MFQQYLPLAVLKRLRLKGDGDDFASCVATIPTVCGIETFVQEQMRYYQ